MIATDRFVFLHLHKSGGTFVNECLLQHVPGARRLGYHLPRSMIPPELAALPVLGTVRSPWSYYVSWHAFQSGMPRGNALYRVLSEEGRLGFEGTIRNMLELGTTGPKLDALLEALPATREGRGLNLTRDAVEPIRGSGLGFYSYLYQYMYGGEGTLHVGRLECLRDDMERLFAAVGQPVTPQMRAFLQASPALNASAHGPFAGYYSRELGALVAERDAPVLDRHGYGFGP